jgi:hydrophobe/amphiphile efflux-1 (HAE1) family protein
MFSKFFIDRPIFATVLALIVIVGGLAAVGELPVAQYPDITPPTVHVSASYPGANAETIAQTVGMPIEQQVNGVEGMIYMSSTSSSSGSYALTVTFEVGTDVDMAAVQVQNRVSTAQSSLPQAVTEQGVTVRKQSSNIVLLLSLTSRDSIYDGLYLSNYATLNLLNELTRVPGVGNVDVMGTGDYSMRVMLDPEAMRIRGVSPEEVYAVIEAQNVSVSAGYAGQSISRTDKNAFQYTLNVEGRLTTPEEFGNMVVKSDSSGRMLRIRDVATVVQGSEAYNMASHLKGRQTATIAIYQQPGSNSLDVARAVRARMDELAKAMPDGVEYEVTLDTTEVISESLTEILLTLVETTIIVVLVIMLFLQNARAVVIPCITIPVSLIGTLAVMWALGYSINMLTLFGLILAVAIVVDDAIVVVENSVRLLEERPDYNAKRAVSIAMNEITGPIVGVVLVLLAVFIPTTLVGGISGQLYKQFAITIAASTVISGVCSLTVTPALCAILLRPGKRSGKDRFGWFNRSYEAVRRVYDRCVVWLLRHPLTAVASYGVLTAIAIVLFMKWPSTFIPEEDDGYFIAMVELPPASSLNRTLAVNRQIDALLDSMDEVESYISVAGMSLTGGDQTSSGSYFVILKPWSERKKKNQKAVALVERFNREADAIEEAVVYAVSPPAIPGLGATGGLQMQLEDTRALGPAAMKEALQSVLAMADSMKDVGSMNSQYQANVPQYFLNIDRDKVVFMGVDLSDVFSTLGYYMGSAYVNDYVRYDHIYQVKISADNDAQRLADDVLRLSVTNGSGEEVPFSTFTTLQKVLGQDAINRYNMFSSAAITASVAGGGSSGEAIRQMEAAADEVLGENFGYQWTSTAYQEIESGSSVVTIFLMALLVVYLVLCAQYESWTSPIAAVIGVPMAILGAMMGCYVSGTPVSIFTQIGIVLLIALSAKNGILIVEFARDYQRAGNSVRQAVVEGANVRLRPILMTSLAFVLGVMPMLFASGAGAESRLSMGAAVVFGMAVNTVLATVFIPCFYELSQRLQGLIDRRKHDASQPQNSDVSHGQAADSRLV